MRWKLHSRRGFTLLEALVAATIMAVAVGGLLSSLSTSMRNASRVTDVDRAAVMGRRIMDEILVSAPISPGQVIANQWDARQVGFEGGWRARTEPFEQVPGAPPAVGTIERVILEVWWMSGQGRRTFVLEAYRRPPRGTYVGGLPGGAP